jgi:hypothetical protein
VTLPAEPAALLSHLRTVCGLKLKLTHAGTLSVCPKAAITDEIRAAIAAVGIPALVEALRAERQPVEREPSDRRPKRPGRVGDLKADAAATWDIIRAANEPPTLFRSAGLAWIEHDDQGHPLIVRLDAARLAHQLAGTILFVVEREVGDVLAEVPVPPPSALVRELLATPDPPLPALTRIVTAPIVTRDGAIHDRPGYDPVSRSFYAPPPGFSTVPVSAAPDSREVAAARDALLDVIADFPLLTEADRAHTLAALLTMFARDLVDGPVPLILFTKPAPGTGASLLCKAIILLATGRRGAAMTEARTEEEWRKRLTAALLEAPAAVFFDNLTGTLTSASLSVALTTDVFQDRLLGENEVVRLPVSVTWLATGNNVTLSTDVSRRTIRVRLDARVERPWLRLRDGLVKFRHPDLLDWVERERPRLVHAALTLIAAWHAAGRPAGTATMGSYEAWSRVLGGILRVAGVPGFLTNVETLYEDMDAETDDAKRFLRVWWEQYHDDPRVPGDLFTLALREDVPLAGHDDHARRVALGAYLRRHAGRPYTVREGLSVTITKHGSTHRARWFLAPTRGHGRAGLQDSQDSIHSSREEIGVSNGVRI